MFRATLYTGSYTFVGSTSAPSFHDTSLSPQTAYLYVVRAVSGAGLPSSGSAPALGSTFVFTDNPLIGGNTAVNVIHLTELRAAVNAVRALAGLPATLFTDPSPSSQATRIRALHLGQLREALSGALSTLSLPPVSLTDVTVIANSTVVKAVHLQEIRNAVK